MTTPTPFQTIRAILRGYLPRLVQARAWTLAGIALFPVLAALVGFAIIRRFEPIPATAGLGLYHALYVPFLLPVLALVAAPAGIREDMEQRTLPLFLVRPTQVWALPFGKGMLWFGWMALWLTLATVLFIPLGISPDRVPALAAALLLAHWAHLGFMSYLALRFKRGVLWGALALFVVDPLVRIFPNGLQRLTFLHHLETIAGSRGGNVDTIQLLAQDPVLTPVWVSALVLLAVGLVFWALCGWQLHSTPLGLAGRESEG